MSATRPVFDPFQPTHHVRVGVMIAVVMPGGHLAWHGGHDANPNVFRRKSLLAKNASGLESGLLKPLLSPHYPGLEVLLHRRCHKARLAGFIFQEYPSGTGRVALAASWKRARFDPLALSSRRCLSSRERMTASMSARTYP